MFYEKVCASAAYLADRIAVRPEVGIVLGSGLGGLVDVIEEKTVIPYGEIPHFPQSTVAGHAGNLIVGRVGKVTVAAMQGRFHYYEGFTMQEVTYPMYVLQQLGVKTMIVTNASGGINRTFMPGDLVLLTDHINLTGTNPLIGANDERFGPRFPDMSAPYSLRLRKVAEAAAAQLRYPCREGVYMYFTGPNFETAAEIRACAALGADAVGMSTVPEVVVANYLGMEVLGISCITNMATGIRMEKHSHEEVLETAEAAGTRLCQWVEEILRAL